MNDTSLHSKRNPCALQIQWNPVKNSQDDQEPRSTEQILYYLTYNKEI